MKYSSSQYAKIFTSLLERAGKSHQKEAVRSFVKMVEENGDLKNEADILYTIEKDLYAKNGERKQEIIDKKHQPSLIGGIKIKIGDTVIDNSVRTRIKNLRSAITKS